MNVLQFGEGNFIRAFMDWMLQKTANATGLPVQVVVAQSMDGNQAEALAAAGTYHVLLRGYEDGQYREVLDPVSVVRAGVNPFRELDRFVALGLDPELSVVTSNTTEAGIFHEPGHDTPHNYASFLALLLHKRALAGLPPLALLPLELLDRNGDDLKKCVFAYARDFGYAPATFAYFDQCHWYNTLVDRIVPGFPREDVERLRSTCGDDPFLTSGELFHLFVIEGSDAILERIPFHEAGLNVIVTRDKLDFYHDRKVRLLNGAHTASVPMALFAGLEEVNRFVDDPAWQPWLVDMMHKEIAFAMDDAPETHAYADEVLQRFRNPALRHSFRSIALNSVAKANTRLRPTLESFWKKTGTVPPRMTAALGKLVTLYTTPDGVRRDLPGGELVLSDFASLNGATTPDQILDRMLPNLEPALRTALLQAFQNTDAGAGNA